MIFFTSDLHFFHDNIIRLAHRPFSSREEMHNILIQNWNERITDRDEVYILGDVTMKGPEFAAEAMEQLNGRKFLVKGNHDRFTERASLKPGLFEWIRDYYELKYQGLKFILFHYPIEEWNGFYRGSYHLHGHQHNRCDYNYNNLAKGRKQYDVGLDANNMTPVSIEEIITFFNGLE